ncbi:hypothetical protein GL218_07433 [Daldinia childiae]|uniref:uncharacterized protein n=1 Tax=Daldinia childiae TaxID=326645 RepID=UPI0014463935|nr:uncharacterized protein GL218_07433 [Daldinia childiae]KAF3054797.1 hypothetical protein GL218_07433 [Daldinia childiae]
MDFLNSPPEDPAKFKRQVLEYIIKSDLSYESVTGRQFESLCRYVDERRFFDRVLFPQGGWMTRDWLIDAYGEIRPNLEPKLLPKGDEIIRKWIVEKHGEERKRRVDSDEEE